MHHWDRRHIRSWNQHTEFSINIKRSAEPVLYLFLDPEAETFIKFSTHYQAEFITADAEGIVIAADTGLKTVGSFF